MLLQACITAIVSTFHDASTALDLLTASRVTRKTQTPPKALGGAIRVAPADIEREKRRGVERFGRAFEYGDYIAIIAIQRIAIELRSQLLAKLQDHDSCGDFEALIDLVDSCRDRTIFALLDLRRRLLQAGTSSPATPLYQPSLVLAERTVPTLPQFEESPVGLNPPSSPLPPPSPPKSQYRAKVQGNIARSPVPRTDSIGLNVGRGLVRHPGNASHRRQSSLLGLLRRGQAANEGMPENGSWRRSSARTISMDSVPATAAVSTEAVQYNLGRNFTFREVDDNQFEIWAPDPISPASERHDSISVQSLYGSAISTTPTVVSPVSSDTLPMTKKGCNIVTAPNADNNYLGFCKGAWRAQNDDPKAWIDRHDFTMSASNSVRYPSCYKCAFRGHLAKEIAWAKVWTDEVRGIKYRWSFLAKSHVKQKNATRSVMDRNYAYQCLFCAFSGTKETVIYTLNTYLDHVSHEHRIVPLSDVVRYRTRCVNDRVCTDDDKFDINIFPRSTVPTPVEVAELSGKLSTEDHAVTVSAVELAA